MKEIEIKDKKKFLEENYPFGEVPDLEDIKRCIHCDTIFLVKDYKVFEDSTGFQYICCPNAPECDGTVIDWFNVE
tara:strand:- start:523 stop:747 length:225 start_codon:yes stop_codon:yes gene_type:complete